MRCSASDWLSEGINGEKLLLVCDQLRVAAVMRAREPPRTEKKMVASVRPLMTYPWPALL